MAPMGSEAAGAVLLVMARSLLPAPQPPLLPASVADAPRRSWLALRIRVEFEFDGKCKFCEVSKENPLLINEPSKIYTIL